MSDELRERFQPLQSGRDGNWDDVLRRAGKRRARRRITLVACVAAVVALAAPTALALRGSIVDFFQSEPAPQPVVLDFAQLDVGAPQGMETEVIAGQARKILEVRGHDGRLLTLYAAPSKKGGFCAFLYQGRGGGGGCLAGYSVPINPTLSIGATTRDGVIHGPVLVWGSVQVDDADSIELRYEGGAVDRQELTRVSKPIDAGFFVFDVRPSHKNENRPQELALLDADGAVLRREPMHFVLPPAAREDGTPAEALLDKARKLISVDTHTGVEAALWVAPTADGRTCHWLRYGLGGFGGGCSEEQSRQRFGLGRSQGKNVVLLWGGPLRPGIRDVEIRYEDGERAEVKAIEGMVLYDIPAEHFPRGHRPFLLVARDSEGREVARQTIPTEDPGSYPCKTPVPIGAGEKACP
jgi:hypothetical protein